MTWHDVLLKKLKEIYQFFSKLIKQPDSGSTVSSDIRNTYQHAPLYLYRNDLSDEEVDKSQFQNYQKLISPLKPTFKSHLRPYIMTQQWK